jgi:hypothetical protein
MAKADWRKVRYTEELIKDIEYQLEGLIGNVTDGVHIAEPEAYARIVGRIEALKAVLMFIYESPEGEDDED